MPYLWLPFFFILLILTLFIGYATILTWRRLRTLEQRLQTLDQQALQGGLSLTEYLTEIERAAEQALQRIQSAREPVPMQPLEQGRTTHSPSIAPQSEPECPDSRTSKTVIAEINRLASEGYSLARIAEELDMGIGEVELVLGLGRLVPPK